MNIKTGDKVRFLNATGGGTVKRFIDKNIVCVEEPDGFETPVLIRECVVVESAADDLRLSSVDAAPKQPVAKNVVPPASEPEIEETAEGEKLTVALAFLPLNLKSLQTSSFECFLINDSNYCLFVCFMNRQAANWSCRHSVLLKPNTKILVENFSAQDLNELKHICLQFVAFKTGKPFELKNPYSVDLRIDPVSLFKIHNFRENDYFEEDARIFILVRNDLTEKPITIDPKALEKAMKEKLPTSLPTPAKKNEQKEVIEVDLHATELLDSLAGLDNAAILNYQLEKFRETLKQYSGKKGQKIVFIHGKGEGVLRKAILDELKTKYKNYYFQDASFREYGFGATLVKIRG
ncbi:MAG: DUF2027 domain-containing protein [Bacteroidales bacterium]|jgi:hypothetical protein|nr:DUF2027 domain-containing protein [Bacteroidales bacterium]